MYFDFPNPGKFGQKWDRPITALINNMEELSEIMNDSSLDVKQCHMISDKVMQLIISKKKEVQPPNQSANVLINAYCTAHARLYLDRAIRKILPVATLGYVDTDCVLGEFILLMTKVSFNKSLM